MNQDNPQTMRRRILGEGAWVVLGQALVIAGSLFGVRVMTGVMDPASYGELALGMTIALLFSQLLFAPISQGASRFYAASREDGCLDQHLATSKHLYLISLSLAMCAGVVAAILARVLDGIGWTLFLLSSIALAVGNGSNAILRALQNAARQRKIVALHHGVETWLRFSLAAILVTQVSADSELALLGYVSASFIILASQLVFFRRVHSDSYPLEKRSSAARKQILQYSWPFATWGIFYWAQRASDRWALAAFEGTEAVGNFAVLFQLGFYPMSLLTEMTIRLVSPILFEKAGDGSDHSRLANAKNLSWAMTLGALALTAVAVLLSAWLHESIFRLLADQRFRGISNLLPGVVLAGGLMAAGQIVALSLMSQLRTSAMASVKIFSAVIGIIGNFAGARLFGIEGVVVASAITAFIYFLWMTILAKIKLKGE